LRVMVTGGAGFIGSHTVDRLIAKGAEVIIVDDLSTGKKENINKSALFEKLDIASEDLYVVFERFKPEFVIHLAAQASVPSSIKNPVNDCRTNVLGSVNLFENCRRYGTAKVVYASSAAVYGNPETITVSEDTPLEPRSFYGFSKLAPEFYLKVFNHLYGLRYTVLRYANVYGPRQNAAGEGGVISIFSTRLLAGQSPVIFGDGEQTRDFVYVEDIAEANLLALNAGDQMVLNIGTGNQTSVNQLFSSISEIAGTGPGSIYAAAREGDIRNSCMDNRVAKTVLGWKPAFSLKDGLAKTYEFYGKLNAVQFPEGES